VKNVLAFFLFFLLFCFSCKKKEAPTSLETQVTTGGVASNGYSGVLTSGKYSTTIFSGITITGTSAFAYFSAEPVLAFDQLKSIRVANIYLNNDSLIYDNVIKYYRDEGNVILGSQTWSVTGSNGISSFNLTNNLAFPSADPFLVFPDSISKTAGCTININNISFITSGSLMLSDGTNSPTGFYSFVLKQGNNVVSILTNHLATLATGSNARLVLLIENSTVVSFSSKNFKLVRENQITKQIKIIP